MEERKKEHSMKFMISEVINHVEDGMITLDSASRIERREPNYTWLCSRKSRRLSERRLTKAEAASLESLLVQLEPSEWKVALERLKSSLMELRTPPTRAQEVPIIFQGILRHIIDERSISNAIREAIEKRRLDKREGGSYINKAFSNNIEEEDVCSSFHIS